MTPVQSISLSGVKSASDLRNLLDDRSISDDEVFRVLEVFPRLALEILTLANSEDYGGGMAIDRLDRAAILLGRDEITKLAARVDDEPDEAGSQLFRRETLYAHLITIAEASALIAEISGLELIHEARAAGLLHDIGICVQLEKAPEEFGRAFRESCESGAILVEHERLSCGTDHCELGEELLLERGIPASIARPIGFHHDPLNAPPEHRYLAIILYAAECLARRAGFGDLAGEQACRLEDRVLAELRLSSALLESQVANLKDRLVRRGFGELASNP